MKISEIRNALEILGVPMPAFVETDGLFSTWDWGSDMWFRWDKPVDYPMPAVLWNRQDGLLLVKKLEPYGAGHRGIVYPMTGKYLVFHLMVRGLTGPLSPYDVGRYHAALNGERAATGSIEYEPFDLRAAIKRLKERGRIEGAEEYAAFFSGKILKEVQTI